MIELTQQYLREALDYDPETGLFTWREDRPWFHFKNIGAWRTWTARYAGKAAGMTDYHGYIVIKTSGKGNKAHRIAWLYVHGQMPNQIDHINGIKHDNRIENQRDRDWETMYP